MRGPEEDACLTPSQIIGHGCNIILLRPALTYSDTYK